MWLSDSNALRRLDSNGAVLQTVVLSPYHQAWLPVFDGANIWVPEQGEGLISTVQVVRAATGEIVATLPVPRHGGDSAVMGTAFDGQRVLVVDNLDGRGYLWDAASLEFLTSVTLGLTTGPFGACSDGASFWIALSGSGELGRL